MVVVVPVERETDSKAILEQAETLADAFDDTVHVVHVMNRSKFLDLQVTNVEESKRPISMERIRSFAADVAATSADELDVPNEPVGLMGDVANQVVKYAQEQGARYIVIAARKRSPTGKALFGSTAQSILLNSKCPVVTVNRTN